MEMLTPPGLVEQMIFVKWDFFFLELDILKSYSNHFFKTKITSDNMGVLRVIQNRCHHCQNWQAPRPGKDS